MKNQPPEEPDPFDVALGQRIRLAREAQSNPRMTMVWLARHLKVSPQQMQKYEKGITPLTVARLDKIARALNIPVIGLLSPANPSSNADPPTS